MGKYAKWIGVGLGVAFGGGIIGAILGYTLGSMFGDNTLSAEQKRDQRNHFNADFRRQHAGNRYQTTPQGFAASLMVLSAAVMKADGKLLKSELEFIKKFFAKQFGPEIAGEQIIILQKLLKSDIPLKEVCSQIKFLMEHSGRLQLLHYLFGIARSDGHVDTSEAKTIEQIADYLGISHKDYISIQSMFFKDVSSAYKVLEIEPSAADAEVKSAFRRMAKKHHPDKVNNMGEAIKEAAEQKFVQIQGAYETIKKERGMK